MHENKLFSAALAETDPMYDAATVTAEGIEYWHMMASNNQNNSFSATKFFIACSIGMLWDRGQISLDDKVTSFFDEGDFPEEMDPRWNEVTVRETLQHKTGLERIPFGVDTDEDVAKIGPDFLKYVFSLPIGFEPGTHYHYSDATYYLLGRIIHRVSGLRAEDFIRENIANPLHWALWGMNKCPAGHTIGGDGLMARADDMAKFAYVCACGGQSGGKQMLSAEWLDMAMREDFACTQFRDTDVYLKTGAFGQCIAFSRKRPAGAAWHGHSDDGCRRNDRMLEAFVAFLDDRFGPLTSEN